jgi:hypothetical protein
MYNNISHGDKKLITIKGKHASPDISIEDMKEILLFCHLNPNIDHSDILDHLKSYMDKPHIRDNGGMYAPGEIPKRKSKTIIIHPLLEKNKKIEIPIIQRRKLHYLKSTLNNSKNK